MPTHYWGDEDFDWDSLYKAETEIRKILKLGRIGVHSKEKYGTLRWDLFLCDGTLHSITHPGYVYSQYPKWLWRFDIRHKPLKWVARFVNIIQIKIVQYAFTKVCNKYPHIRDEIIMDAPREILPPDLALASAKMWSNTCNKCDQWSTTDNYICPHCGEIKNER
jgi:hypothetical protein